MSHTDDRECEIFSAALQLAEAAKRTAYLDEACGDDAALRKGVESLLHAHEGNGGLLKEEDEAPSGPGDAPVHEGPGSRIGRYKLLERIGEGGFGVVYMAEQDEPVRRRVALKIIKPGMDTRAVVARFEAERQALAMMEHPGIARVFDGGATDSGRPYFVMELVRGVPITRYCDEKKMKPGARLRLFIAVCNAVQHAHQKGVIHRDLKPSNILVTMDDGAAVPKVIDFGIAKATNARLTDKTLFTRFHTFVGTPAYTSPEQMDMSSVDVDTRSDIYSLGVLLYELLLGRPPFDPKLLSAQDIDTMRRTIREVDPPRPSARLATLSQEDRTSVAHERGTEPASLTVLLRGDLDWIVMRALEKDRARRYQTAAALAADIERHMANEPVVARPPSTLYRAGKFVRRHKVGVSVTVAIVVLVVIGSIGTTVLTLRALRAERLHAELREAAERASENESVARRAAALEQERNEKIRWARETALPEINRLIKIDDIAEAFALARVAEEFIADDPALVDLWPKITGAAAIETNPPGAAVHAKPYRKPSADWEYVGTTPIANARLARAPYRYRITKEGFETLNKTDTAVYLALLQRRRLEFELVEDGSPEATPPGMVRVPGKSPDTIVTGMPAIDLGDYWIDTHEVTNREFKAFVDAGGYATEQFWEHPFAASDGRVLAWTEAIALFRDSTGMPGPATWTSGTYAAGRDDYPVTGVSWFEAAAYARFAGKRLPSLHHWRYATPTVEIEHVIHFSNLQGRGLAPAGHHQGMHVHGTYDMAGNAKEWCWNEAEQGKRYLLGGGWREPAYMFNSLDAQSAFDRSDQNGFRCVKQISDRSLDERVDAPRVDERRDYAAETPVSDAEFQAFKILYDYDKPNLDPVLESSDDSPARWRRELVAFNAAYNGERMHAILFLPKSSKPPYQTI
ncbi:MAG TPA: bifunctional serine/threonine-protein kinase/formylglycine-generating enzyme family protein, partial [Opitutaceae bacterium]|nr:bifunctional serine/threonine-protein kinase/formylglycine-generating enzyme family protein [Opitutaceae bacterium]